MSLLVLFKDSLQIESFVTRFAHESEAASMNRLMVLKTGFGCEALPTNVTLVLQTLMSSHVIVVLMAVTKSPSTQLTVETEYSSVDLHVSLQVMFPRKVFVAQGALMSVTHLAALLNKLFGYYEIQLNNTRGKQRKKIHLRKQKHFFTLDHFDKHIIDKNNRSSNKQH